MKLTLAKPLILLLTILLVVFIWVTRLEITAPEVGGGNDTEQPTVSQDTADARAQISGRGLTESVLGKRTDATPEPVMIRGQLRNSQLAQLNNSDMFQNSIAYLLEDWPWRLETLDGADFDLDIEEVAKTLREIGKASDFAWLAAQLRDPSLSLEVRTAYAHLLEKVATREAAKILLDYLARSDADADMVNATSRSVREIAHTLMNGSRNLVVAPVLEDAWRNASPDASEEVLSDLATSIAYLGEADGVRGLIEAVSELPDDVTRDDKSFAALSSLSNISNPDAVPILGEALDERLPDDLFFCIVLGLLNVGNADSYWAVIPALQNLPEISDEDYQRIEYAAKVKHGGIKPESSKVLRSLNELTGFADVRLANLFSGEPINSEY